jgi:NADH dehydrogenase [ubiquinone] 1 alpha subcomplex assembly factor 6
MVKPNILLYNVVKNASPNRPSHTPAMFCIEQVKKYDYENFLSTLLIRDQHVRRFAFAIRAFNVELAQVGDVTSTEHSARGRYAFWTDVIDEIFRNQASGDSHHSAFASQPVVKELIHNIYTTPGPVSKIYFKRLIEARGSSKHLTKFPFATIDELEHYSSNAVTPIYMILNEVAIARQDLGTIELPQHSLRIKLDHIASHTGKAQGIANVLRGLAHNARSGRCYIPSDLLAQSSARHEDFLRGLGEKKEVQDVCFELASRAHSELEQAEELIEKDKKILTTWLSVFLPLYPVRIYLTKLQTENFNAFSKKLSIRDTNLAIKLWIKSIRFKFGF